MERQNEQEAQVVPLEEPQEEQPADVRIDMEAATGVIGRNDNGERLYTIESLSNSGGVPRFLQQTRRHIPLWRRGDFLRSVWFVLTSGLLLVAIILHSVKEKPPKPDLPEAAIVYFNCESKGMRITHWVIVQLGLQLVMLVVHGGLQRMLPASDTQAMSERRLKNIMSLYIITKFSNLLWLVWSMLGIIWAFETQSCGYQIGPLFSIAFSICIAHLIGFCVPVVVCCCSLPVAFVTWYACPTWFARFRGEAPPKTASKREIKKLTQVVKYQPLDENTTSMSAYSIQSEDANCAICLGDYVAGEELRFLPCKHHFHGECVIQWLQQNKTCPFCKKPIDLEVNKPESQEMSSV